MNKRFLVVVSASDSSRHVSWLEKEQGRDWDLVVSYGGTDPRRYPESGDGMVRIDTKGARWQALAALLSSTVNVWQGYDYIWLPEDDLEVSCADINLLFALASGIKAPLGQPSLTADSLASRTLAFHNPSFALRYSSFADPIAPLFSRDLLRRALPTFAESIHGCGLECIWPRLLNSSSEHCVIFDRVQVRRTRPLGGVTASSARDMDVDPRRARLALLQRYGISEEAYLCFGGYDSEGRFLNLFDPHSENFLANLCGGYLERLQGRPGELGRLYADHALARRRFLAAAAPAIQAGPRPVPAVRVQAAPAAQAA